MIAARAATGNQHFHHGVCRLVALAIIVSSFGLVAWHGFSMSLRGSAAVPFSSRQGSESNPAQQHLTAAARALQPPGGSQPPTPHGGSLVQLLQPRSEKGSWPAAGTTSATVTSWVMTKRQLCDIELLLNGGFSPLHGFMGRLTYASVLNDMRLAPVHAAETAYEYPSVLWSMPIMLDLPGAIAKSLKIGNQIKLHDEYNNVIAVMTVGPKPSSRADGVNSSQPALDDWVWPPDKMEESKKVFTTTDKSHPGVAYLLDRMHDYYVGGWLVGVQLPLHVDFHKLRLTPAQVRSEIAQRQWARTVAFQTRNPMHRAHIELTRLASLQAEAGVLLHPVVGMTKPGDVEYSVRVKCYEAVVKQASKYYGLEGNVILSLLPLGMRMAGPREALWHAIVRKNFGASHFIIGRDHAGCKDGQGNDFYGTYDAQNLVLSHADELGIKPMVYHEIEYVPSLDAFFPSDKIPAGPDQQKLPTLSISGTKFRKMMARGDPIPSWYSDPAVIRILQSLMPPTSQRGFCIFFTGLSGSGKTTISHAVVSRLQSLFPTRKISVLDGDVVRTHLSKGLGFTVEDRNTNVERIAFVAAEVVKQGGIAIAAPIAPFESSRLEARRMIEAAGGGFLLVHVSTSLATCAQRDVKGLYNGAGYEQFSGDGMLDLQQHVNMELTGVSHPYESPWKVDVTVDTDVLSVEMAVTAVLSRLVASGYVSSTDTDTSAYLTDDEKNIAAAFTKEKADESAGCAPHVEPEASPLNSVMDALQPPRCRPSTCSSDWSSFRTQSHTAFISGGLPMKGTTLWGDLQAAAGKMNVTQHPFRVQLALSATGSGSVRIDPHGINALWNPARVEQIINNAANGAPESTKFQEKPQGFEPLFTLIEPPHQYDIPQVALPLPKSPAASVRAAYDLWTALRWARHYLSAALHQEGPKQQDLIVFHAALGAFTNSELVAHVMRLDPCLSVIVDLPAESMDDDTWDLLQATDSIAAHTSSDSQAAGNGMQWPSGERISVRKGGKGPASWCDFKAAMSTAVSPAAQDSNSRRHDLVCAGPLAATYSHELYTAFQPAS